MASRYWKTADQKINYHRANTKKVNIIFTKRGERVSVSRM